ncbi:MAG: hypothetical protein VB013_08670 [Anaerolineaceae bacterium]|nr:hypothetical protein [Anaerolineaceae bacterium]
MPENPKTQKRNSDLRSRIWLILIVIVMIAFTIWASGPVPDKNAPLYPTPSPTAPVLTPKAGTPMPTPDIEIIEKTPTTGVIYGAVFVSVLLVAGVLISVRTMKD